MTTSVASTAQAGPDMRHSSYRQASAGTTLFPDRRPQRPDGMEAASCLKCHAQYTFWTRYQNQTDLQCITCGHYLATWVPRSSAYSPPTPLPAKP